MCFAVTMWSVRDNVGCSLLSSHIKRCNRCEHTENTQPRHGTTHGIHTHGIHTVKGILKTIVTYTTNKNYNQLSSAYLIDETAHPGTCRQHEQKAWEEQEVSLILLLIVKRICSQMRAQVFIQDPMGPQTVFLLEISTKL